MTVGCVQYEAYGDRYNYRVYLDILDRLQQGVDPFMFGLATNKNPCSNDSGRIAALTHRKRKYWSPVYGKNRIQIYVLRQGKIISASPGNIRMRVAEHGSSKLS